MVQNSYLTWVSHLEVFAQCKQCQAAYVKTYLNMQYNEQIGCALRNITSNLSLVKHWASWSFLMKIHPVERKLYIINGGTTALVFDESIKISLMTLRRMHWWLIPCVNIVFQYSLSAINRLIACLHFRVQRDYKMPRNLGVTGNAWGLHPDLDHRLLLNRGIGFWSVLLKCLGENRA